MITVHNLQGLAVAINGALIERVDGGPETHLMLVNGTSYIVRESIEEVVRLHREDRAVVQALADRMGTSGIPAGPVLDGATKDGPLRLLAPAPSEDGGGTP
ncbi:MAG: fliO2 [Acidimicrobiaceae bacterium]|jgi:flagellar protein FlbD|nr:fliO2 [Acidimicrobiaceae bacterium]